MLTPPAQLRKPPQNNFGKAISAAGDTTEGIVGTDGPTGAMTGVTTGAVTGDTIGGVIDATTAGMTAGQIAAGHIPTRPPDTFDDGFGPTAKRSA